MFVTRDMLMKFVFFLLEIGQLAAFFNNNIFIRHPQDLIVKTKLGYIQGRVSPKSSRDGREFYEWLGIPYAKPPIGSLRFASPESFKNWVGIRDGTRYGASCAQNTFYFENIVFGKEDCLFLNIHAPKVYHNEKKLLPVLFYIHGGAYLSGGSNIYRPNFLMDQDVIFVSINYRLDILGFLSTGDKVIRGNMGLKDQVQALKWVSQNIASFGGDPNRITIFGHSAGAASVHLHLLSPMSKGLFARAISHSGTALNTWSLQSHEVSMNKTRDIGIELGCPTRDTQLLAQCLRDASVADLMRTVWLDTYEFPGVRPNKYRNSAAPTIEAVNNEDAFLTEHPMEIVGQGKAHRVPWMVGHTADEGLLAMTQIVSDNRALLELDVNVLRIIKQMFGLETKKDADKTAGAIQDFYLLTSKRSSLSKQKMLEAYTNLFSDGLFNFEIRESILYQRQFSPVYPYFLNKKDGPSFWLLLKQVMSESMMDMVELALHTFKSAVSHFVFGVELPQKMAEITGIGHAADALYIFPLPPFIYISSNSKNYKFSKDYIQLIVDFASKNESELLKFNGAVFPATPKTGQLKFLEINNNPGIIPQPFEDRMTFLESLCTRNFSSKT